MNTLLESGLLSERSCGANFAYLLNGDLRVQPTEYKVLQRCGQIPLLRCMAMRYNGRTELLYLSAGCRALSAMLPTMSASAFLIVVQELLDAVREVGNNGFLSRTHIDLSFQKIFVDPGTHKVFLSYLPLDRPLFEDAQSFTNCLRAELIDAILSFPASGSGLLDGLLRQLREDALPLESIQTRTAHQTAVPLRTPSWNGMLRLVALDAPMALEIQVHRVPFTIGKNAGIVDAALTYNQAISRLHCRITKLNGRYQITDLGSVNGTFVNGGRLTPNLPYQIENGDTVLLANSSFRVNIG